MTDETQSDIPTPHDDEDRAVLLAELRLIREERKKLKDYEERLRDTLAPVLYNDGPVYLIDPVTKAKIYAYYSKTEPLVVNLEALRAEVSDDLYQELVRHELNSAAWAAAVAAEKLDDETIVKVAKIDKSRKPTVLFSKPEKTEDGDA